MKCKKAFMLALAISAVFILVSSTLAACAPKAPAAPRIVKVGLMMELTGPASQTMGRNTLATFLAYWRNINETGGIRGVQVDPQWEDVAFNVDRSVAAYKKFKDVGAVAVNAITTLSGEAIQPLSTRDKIPVVVSSTTDKLADPSQWSYVYYPSYTQMFVTFMKWVKDNWKDTSRRPRIAQIGWDAPIGREHVARAEEYGAKIGVDVGPWEFIPTIPLDTTPNLLRIRDAKPDYVVIQSGNSATGATILRDAQRLGILDKFTWVGGLQTTHWEPLNTWSDLADGILGISSVTYPEEASSVPGLKAMNDTIGKYVGPDSALKRPYYGTTTQLFYTAYFLMSEAIGKAIDKVGYDKLTPSAVNDAILSISNADVMKGLTPPLTFGPTRHQGAAAIRLVKLDWKAGTWRPVTGWLESAAVYNEKGAVTFK